MTTKKQIEIAEAIVNTGLVSKVYHSVQLIKDDNFVTQYPVYRQGKEYVYTGLDDARGLFAYIRNAGDTSGVPLKIQSCGRSYDMDASLRIVFFNDNEERDQDELLRQLASFTFLTGVTLQRIITDKFRLVKEESQIFRQRFDGKTFYAAFDVLVSFILLPSDCATDECVVYKNPVTTCPAAIATSTSSATS
jgi:hypothetical protein